MGMSYLEIALLINAAADAWLKLKKAMPEITPADLEAYIAKREAQADANDVMLGVK